MGGIKKKVQHNKLHDSRLQAQDTQWRLSADGVLQLNIIAGSMSRS